MKSAENGVVLVWSNQQVKNAICVFDNYETYNNKPLEGHQGKEQCDQ